MRLRIFGLIFTFGLLQLWLLPAPGFAYNAHLDLSSGEVYGDQAAIEFGELACQVTVLIRGGGAVNALLNDGQEQNLTSYNNVVDIPCAETVLLTAETMDFWVFEGWEVDLTGETSDPTIQASPGQILMAVFRPLGLSYETVDVPFYDRNGNLTNQVPKIQIPEEYLLNRAQSPSSTPPVINAWYSDNQTFGQIGMPQKYVNILGNASDPDGFINNLKYSLNGGPDIPLSFGPDGRRLQEFGDFNIDLDETTLQDGENTVIIKAVDNSADQSQFEVIFDYDANSTWPLPSPAGYFVDWDVTGNIQDAGQVVDGQWSVLQNGIRNYIVGYDRVVAFGDQLWTDYEAQVEIEVHSVDPRGFDPGNAAPAIGIFMHWTGHTDLPPVCDPAYRPKCGWLPSIASWYEWDKDQMGGGIFSLWFNHNQKKEVVTPLQIEEGEKYIWKIRAESSTGTNGKYKFKVWHVDDPEPEAWFKDLNGQSDSPEAGSILLAAHYVDITFGNVTVKPLNGQPDITPPIISNLAVAEEHDGATIYWTTDEPSTSTVNYGSSPALGQTATDSDLKTEHYIYLGGLTEEQTYHFEVLSADSEDNIRTVAGTPFSTQSLIAILSDDFNYCELNLGWNFIDPIGDSDYLLAANELNINVPGGTAHDIWTAQGEELIRAPRLMRDVTDPNNLQVKFTSGVNQAVQFQGIIFEQDEENLFRASFQYSSGKTELYVIGHRNGGSTVLKKVTVNGANPGGPLYLWNTRENGRWNIRYSTNGTQWSDAGHFDFPLAVESAGLFAGNVAGPSQIPPVNLKVDYWFNANSPIVPEDGVALNLPVNIQGNGDVSKNPECGNPVKLTAAPNPGWHFVQWTGSPINGSTNPVIDVDFDFGDEVTAVFEQNEDGPYGLQTQVIGQGSVTKDPNKSLYNSGESVTVTAVPDSGWKFDHWEGAIAGNQVTRTVIMNSNKIITAVFVEDSSYELQIQISGSGNVYKFPNKSTYELDETIQLSAVANSGWRFVRWEGDISGTDPVAEVKVTGDLFIRAIFIQVFEQTYLVHLPFVKR